MVSSTVYRKNADKRATLWVTMSNVAVQGQHQSSDSARVRPCLHWQAMWLRLLLNEIFARDQDAERATKEGFQGSGC
jgi:hypothetical protein